MRAVADEGVPRESSLTAASRWKMVLLAAIGSSIELYDFVIGGLFVGFGLRAGTGVGIGTCFTNRGADVDESTFRR